MKDYSHIVSKITSTPWMIEESSLRMILDILDAHMKGTISQEEIRIRLAEKDRSAPRHSRNHGPVGVLALNGPIFPKANLMTELSGATSVEQFRNEFRTMLSDDTVESILLEIDSPGGLADQIPEMANEVYEANKIKPVVSVANTMCCSAAYYIGSQASHFFASPSAIVGSIGTYTVHTDYSEQNAMLGMRNTVIKAGKYKALNEEPLTADGKQHIQEFVDWHNTRFVDAVARGRNTTSENVALNYGEGGVVSLDQAMEVGMIDGVKTIDTVLSDMNEHHNVVAMHQRVAQWVGSNTTSMSYDADKEHSEPGTGQGGEPTPREAPEEGDKAIKGGWRRDPPPVAYPEPEQSKGGVVVDRAYMEALATRLNLDFNDETTDEELSAIVAERVENIVVPMNSVVEQAERRRKFADEFPDEAARMERYERRNREGEAREFAESYARFSEAPKLGFSTVVRNALEEAHIKLSDRQFTTEDLETLVNTMASDKSIVTWEEAGSSRQRELVAIGSGNPRQQLNDLVKARMQEDGMTYEAALAVVAKENPELARAYVES
jgi:capsid assembly protease